MLKQAREEGQGKRPAVRAVVRSCCGQALAREWTSRDTFEADSAPSGASHFPEMFLQQPGSAMV